MFQLFRQVFSNLSWFSGLFIPNIPRYFLDFALDVCKKCENEFELIYLISVTLCTIENLLINRV